MNYIRMTTAQAIVRFLDNQYVSFDGVESKFVEGFFCLFGHGIVCGLGQALDAEPGNLKVFQGKNEQGMAHVAASFAKQHNRRKIIACASSIGPGAANMITAAATATVNNIPLLLFPGDTYASRQPDPVLQQVEQPQSLTITTNDAYKPVVKYWDRIVRPEQVMTALINAMRVLTDTAETGAVCISLPQDAEAEAYDYPEEFFAKRVHRIKRIVPEDEELEAAAKIIFGAKKPLVVVGGGARYSEAGKAIEDFCAYFNIPFGETQAGKSACLSSDCRNLGGIGATGNLAANTLAADADVVIGVGTRFSDFTTASKSLYKNENVKFISINTSRFHAIKLDAYPVIGDAKATILALTEILAKKHYISAYTDEIVSAKKAWDEEMIRLSEYTYGEDFKPLVKPRYAPTINDFIKTTGGTLTQTEAIAVIRELIDKNAVIVGASGSLPGCLQRMWATDSRYSYNMEYGYSCMGYEIAGALGSKLAATDREVYAMTGDGSYLMLHSEMVTAIQEGVKINILLFDNSGFGCINNLEMSKGIGNLATEFRRRDKNGELLGEIFPIDFAMSARAYGFKAYTAHNKDELRAALEDAKKQAVSTLIDLKVLPKTMTDGYLSWWNTGVAEVGKNDEQIKAYDENEKMRYDARRY